MEIMKLSNIATISAGQSAPQGDECYTNDGIPFVKAGNLSELIEHNDENQIQKVSEKTISDYKLKLYPKGTILFAKSGMSCMKGLVYVLKQDCYVVSHLACITPLNIESDYLKYYFKYHKPNTLVKDESYPSISLKDIGDMPIKIFNEEKRKEIIENLNKLNLLIDTNKSLLKKYNDLAKSQFIEMFGDPLSNNIFELQELNTVCDVRDGTHDSPKYHNIGYPLITSKNIINGGISFDDVNLISKEDYDKINQRSFVDNGDILMPMIGTIGNPVIVDKIKDFAIKNVALIKFYKDSKIDNHFLYYLMKSDSFNSYLKEKNKGGTQKFVSLGIIRKIKIITPPIELQNQFADFVKHIDKLKFTLKQTLEKLENCYHSLMQEYFE